MSAAVTVIGLGPMGQAIASKCLEAGHQVTVWNRTPSRADALVARGATLAPTAAGAVAENKLVILSLTDYRAMYDILGTAGHSLAGRVVVNLSSDTPAETRKAAEWLAGHGAELLAGGIMAPAPLVGTESSYVFYSGSREVFDQHEETLRPIGRPDFRGEDVTLAQLYYQAQLDIFLTGLAAVMHSFALIGSAGVAPETFAPYATENLNSLSMYVEETVRDITTGKYPGEMANVLMMGATAAHIVGASESGGIDAELPKAVLSLYDRAVAAGHGRDNWTSLAEVIRKR